MKNQYAVIHVQKSEGKGGALGRHIERTFCPANANAELASENKQVIPNAKGDKLYLKPLTQRVGEDGLPIKSIKQRVDERIAEGYKGKMAIRKDAVRQLNVILTGSHEQMVAIGKDKKKLVEWMQENHKFLADRFGGEQNIVSFVLHMDEATPHIHATVVPLTKDGRLSAKEMVGDKNKLKALQDSYGEKMSKYGLCRGKNDSKAKHINTQEYYRTINSIETGAIEEMKAEGLSFEKPEEIEITHFNHKDVKAKIAQKNAEISKLKEQVKKSTFARITAQKEAKNALETPKKHERSEALKRIDDFYNKRALNQPQQPINRRGLGL